MVEDSVLLALMASQELRKKIRAQLAEGKPALSGAEGVVDPDGAETIEGVSSFAVLVGTSITIAAAADGWIIV